jgi:hypothetical protein
MSEDKVVIDTSGVVFKKDYKKWESYRKELEDEAKEMDEIQTLCMKVTDNIYQTEEEDAMWFSRSLAVVAKEQNDGEVKGVQAVLLNLLRVLFVVAMLTRVVTVG